MPPLPAGLHLPAAVVVAALVAGFLVMLAWRVRETQRPVTLAGIVAPPLGMSTGFAMFAMPQVRVPWAWAAVAFAAGAALFAIPLARTSRLERRGDAILLRRSRAFLWILLGLAAVRWGLRSYVEHLVSPAQTGALFFILAFGMIARWRVSMLLEYRRLLAAPAPPG